MARLLFAATLIAGLVLTGCASPDRAALLKDLQGCKRHYAGSAGAGALGAPGVTVTFEISCDPLVTPPAPEITP